MKTSRHPAAGFTLIELLTVIAIIGILAAIIIPVTGRVRASARQASGLAIMKNIGMAIYLHTADYKDMLPGPINQMQYVSMRWQDHQITYRLAQYIGSAGYPKGQLVPQICPPGFDKQVADITETPAYIATDNVDDGGGVNDHTQKPTRIKPFGNSTGAGEDAVPKKITRIVDPARKVALMDFDNELYRVSGKAGSVQAKHLDKPFYGSRRNALYFDGHVRSVPATASYEWGRSDFP
ncbi:pilus assembly FimT family protein [Geminisphaera colitermitum]|uniref:pilus assembly FimT family protein n=1 Tax=Geminisphaera colitermitum TaxID=1148786 RepID=UPI000158C540|nr:prepilin-type N-terminal cleavage/methylation domain-containing protein [Geminisphaera colitermitum]